MKLSSYNLLEDIYYSKKLAEAYLGPDGELFSFEHREGDSFFCNLAVRRPVKLIGSAEINENFYDLETPYGYGGYYTNSDDPAFVERALGLYAEKCLEQNIIAEFLRFHPLNHFPEKFGKVLDFCRNDRKTVYVPLGGDYDSIRKGYRTSLKRNIAKAEKTGLVFRELAKTPANAEIFRMLYNKTMSRHDADEFYFFDEKYFEKIFSLEELKLFGIEYEENIVCAVIVYESFPLLYYHLGATDPDFYSLNCNPFVFDCLIRRYSGKFEAFYLGGGTSGDEEDSLLRFKRNFSETTWDFFIGGKVFNRNKYCEYCNIRQEQAADETIRLFLKYRMP